jgi:integrase
MPPAPDTVAAYLAASGEGYALTTLRRRVAAIAHFCRKRRYFLDTRVTAIRATIKGIARNHGMPSRRAAALTADDVQHLCEVCDDALTGKRDRALILLGFAGALRRSELVGVDVDHITRTRAGFVLTLLRSKTDQEGRGADISIMRGEYDETCPVKALRAWRLRPASTRAPSSAKSTRPARRNSSDCQLTPSGRYFSRERHWLV